MKSVVTGGCGFIGSHVVDALVDRGDRVVVVDDLATGDLANLNPRAELLLGSILDASLLERAFEGAGRVFHLAALPRISRSIEDPVGTGRVNVLGTLNVFEAARRASVGRTVYSSSSSVYGAQPTHLMYEEMPPDPLSPYALQKLMGEQFASMFARLYGMTIVSLRYFNVYGARQPFQGPYALVIGKFLHLARCGRALTIYGDGEQTRSYCHVSDVARANLLAADADLPTGRNTVLNIGSREETSVNEIARMVCGKVEHILPNPRGTTEEQRKAADSSRAASLLGWAPSVSLRVGIGALAAASNGAGVTGAFPRAQGL